MPTSPEGGVPPASGTNASDHRDHSSGTLAIQIRTGNGSIIYSPRNPLDRLLHSSATPAFPTPHIRPRPRRPHTIHIVSYPPGYVPSELRRNRHSRQPDHHKNTDQNGDALNPHTARPNPQNKPNTQRPTHKNSRIRIPRSTLLVRKLAPAASDAPPSSGTRAFEKLLAAFSSQPPPLPPPASTEAAAATAAPLGGTLPQTNHTDSRPSLSNLGRRLSRTLSHNSHTTAPPPASAFTSASAPARTPASTLASRDFHNPLTSAHVEEAHISASMTRSPVVVDALRPTSLATPHHGSPTASHRNSFISVRSVKNIMTSSVSEIAEKPVASGGGLACSILLAEPNIFLNGFDHDGRSTRSSNNGTALLRGKLQLNVSKNVKIRAVTLKLQGKARTEWPEGIPPLKLDLYEEESLRTQALTFFHAMHESWETPYGNQCTYTLKTVQDNYSFAAALNKFASPATQADNNPANFGLTARDIKRLSLQQTKARSFGKGDSPIAHPVQAKGYKIFLPGTYEYSFELPIDHHQLETIRLPFGSVRWELETTVERAGAFKPNLHGAKEVHIIRVPDQLSLETVEPISIRRQWEDQLFYDIVISGKSFPIGSKIPIAFKLAPLAKVQVHKLKVFVTETTEYWTNNRRVTRKDPGRKILLFEKSAGKPIDPQYATSEVNVLSGGELSNSERTEARAMATRRREIDARLAHQQPDPLPEPTDNLLGDLDLGLEAFWGATEMELNVQIPTCEQMAKNPNLRLHPDCSWRNANVYHWIKLVMRISRLDPDDPAGKRRRHFEISIDSPFTILSCLATQANTALPQYSGIEPSINGRHRATSYCGCSDAPAHSTPDSSPTPLDLTLDAHQQDMPHLPQAAHLQAQPADPSSTDGHAGTPSPTSDSPAYHRQARSDQEGFENPRPMHLLRVPSFAPPAFDADESPPVAAEEVPTPPPNYDAIVGTPSVDGLADYFSRLADYEHPHDGDSSSAAVEDDSDSDEAPTRITSRGGRVNIANPRTPGGIRHGPSRSMDIQRPNVPFHLTMPAVLRRGVE